MRHASPGIFGNFHRRAGVTGIAMHALPHLKPPGPRRLHDPEIAARLGFMQLKEELLFLKKKKQKDFY
jgi:hypothetical protein